MSSSSRAKGALVFVFSSFVFRSCHTIINIAHVGWCSTVSYLCRVDGLLPMTPNWFVCQTSTRLFTMATCQSKSLTESESRFGYKKCRTTKECWPLTWWVHRCHHPPRREAPKSKQRLQPNHPNEKSCVALSVTLFSLLMGVKKTTSKYLSTN
jgi:hypothetical protein